MSSFDTGAAYARRHLFCGASVDKVSFKPPRLVDVPPPSGALAHARERLTTSYMTKGAQLTGGSAHDGELSVRYPLYFC